MRHYMRDVQRAAYHTESRIAALPLLPEHPVAIANAGLRAELLPDDASVPHEELGVFAEKVIMMCLCMARCALYLQMPPFAQS